MDYAVHVLHKGRSLTARHVIHHINIVCRPLLLSAEHTIKQAPSELACGQGLLLPRSYDHHNNIVTMTAINEAHPVTF